jgi:hypothetical protein
LLHRVDHWVCGHRYGWLVMGLPAEVPLLRNEGG